MRSSSWVLCCLLAACKPQPVAAVSGAGSSVGPQRAATSASCVPRIVSAERLRGVVFDASCTPELARRLSRPNVTGSFVPTDEQIHALEAGLRPALERELAEPGTLYGLPDGAEDRREAVWGLRDALHEILEHYVRYRRQYVGIVLT